MVTTEPSSRLKDLRGAAKAKFDSLPWPVRTDEEWRRTDPKKFPVPADLEAQAPFKAGWDAAAPEAIKAGVILTDMETAAKQFPDLLERSMFQTGEQDGLRKYAALHQAVARQGLFCYVPDGVKVELPLRSWIESAGGPVLFPHVLIVVGRDAEATLVDERKSAAGSAEPVFSIERVEILVREGGSLSYVHLQQWNESASELFMQRAVLEKGAQLLDITVGLGGKLAKSNIETVITGPGARADLLGIYFAAGKQHFDVHTLQDHQAPNSFSDLLYKNALAEESESVYTGLIRIAKQAQKTDAYQANRNLLLSQGAKADSIPMLEIEANDVRCTHGVAVSPVDEEQAFYLMSRGIPATDAERLIVEGFFEQILKRIPVGDLRERLAAEIAERLETHTKTDKGEAA